MAASRLKGTKFMVLCLMQITGIFAVPDRVEQVFPGVQQMHLLVYAFSNTLLS
jgi:hypothetical protein